MTGDVCFAKDHKLGSMFAEGMFCAGGDGFGPCHGDSGNKKHFRGLTTDFCIFQSVQEVASLLNIMAYGHCEASFLQERFEMIPNVTLIDILCSRMSWIMQLGSVKL